MQRAIKFSNTRQDFFVTLNQRVNEYFKKNQISKHGDIRMYVKTAFMFSLYFFPFFIMISGAVANLWVMFALCLVMGVGLAGIGLSIMHDANHGGYSSKPWLNNLMGYSLNMVGGNAFNWKVQHNVLHHTFTNIHDVDEDISPRGVLRMAPGSPWKPMHKYQHIYAWFLYGLMTFVWIVAKDFFRLIKYQNEGLVKKQKANIVTEWIILLVTKAAYVGYIFVLPMVLLPITWWQWLIGFMTMHYVSGFILAIIFQPAHVIDGTEYPMPDEQGNLENSWAIHQMLTTTNFANKNRVLSWYVGGLNYQVEHHLFPSVCHIHYRKLAPIVKLTAEEFGVPYKSQETFIGALKAHAKLLKELGRRPVLQVA
ncbi:MAG: acyl-CoA desaturase [Flammeovirgaceae bacterium]|nr:acyl-CoA desaturase [Flammeovirgaceae bacterium]